MTAAQAPVVVGLPPLVSMFNSTGTAYAADTKVPGRASGTREALRALVQRQRHSGALLDSDARTARLRHDSVPDAAGARSRTTFTCSAAWTTAARRQRPSHVA